jgi:hypothetical protein
VDKYITTTGIHVHSDKRIKTNIKDIPDNGALNIFRKLKPCIYEYKDKSVMGTDTTIGFIAQEVHKIIPRAVNIMKKIIPSINKMCSISNNNTITLDNITLSDISLNYQDVSGVVIAIIDKDVKQKEFNIKTGVDNSTFIIDDVDDDIIFKTDSFGKMLMSHKDEVTNEIIYKRFIRKPGIIYKRGLFGERLFDVSGILITELMLDEFGEQVMVDTYDISGNPIVETYNGDFGPDKIYIYGHEVDDFQSLDKHAIWTVAAAATQEIDRQLQETRTLVSTQQETIQSQQLEIENLQSDIAIIKAALNL